MPTVAEELQAIDDFNKLLPFLKNQMGWPIDQDILDEDDPLEEATFEFTPAELGIDPDKTPNIRGIRQLRPFHQEQPFGIFLISFEDKDLKVTAMRRLLRALVKKKRETSNDGTQQRWDINDLMFISNYGMSGHRRLSFAHFNQNGDTRELPTLRVIGWDEDDTPTRLRIQASDLTQKLKFPDNPSDISAWRAQWNDAFSQKPGQVISTTKDLVTRLAQLATQTRQAIEDVLSLENQNGALHGIMKAFQESIFPDLKSEGFADMYAQTVAYGLLQARISRISGGLVLDDAANVMGATNPFLKQLFESFLSVGENKSKLDFDEIGLSEVRDLLAEADMEQVLADFENKNPNQDPKIHLYENFLKEYDKDRKDSHGVFYTPREVVNFIVRSVHETLQTDFGLSDGLADITTWTEFAQSHSDVTIPEGWADKPFVQILDPATGTGTFLIETIEIIHNHLVSKWTSEGKSSHEIQDLWQDYVPTHLLPRLNGFELMMAPYAMAHLGIALKLDQTGYKHVEGAPRAEVYLTNSLAEPFDASSQLGFMADALADEGRGANRVKVDVPITVIIGNPPYSGHSMNASKDVRGKPTWIGKLIQPYFFVDGAPLGERNSKWLNDDYVKFIRYAEALLEKSGKGIMSYITNHSFLDSPTFRGMRQHLIKGSSSLYILDLHGNAKKKETAPDGSKDENVFDIQQGVSIFCVVKNKDAKNSIKIGDIFGERKVKLSNLSRKNIAQLSTNVLEPRSPFYMLMKSLTEEASEYFEWVGLSSIIKDNVLGYQSHRDSFAISFEKHDLVQRVDLLLDRSVKTDFIRDKFDLKDKSDWQLAKARSRLERFANPYEYVIPTLVRPFDKRFCYLDIAFMDRPRPLIQSQIANRINLSILVSRQQNKLGFSHIFVSDVAPESCAVSNLSREGNYVYPLLRYESGGIDDINHNIASSFLKSLGATTKLAFQQLVTHPSKQLPLGTAPAKPEQQQLLSAKLHERGDLTTTFGCRDVFDFMYAIPHSPVYRQRYAEFLKSDFPRIPLPRGKDIFRELVKLGKELVDLHLLNEEHSKLAQPSIVFRGQGDNRLFKKAQIMWDNGKMPINATQWFEDVPEESVEFSIGGYQPLKKWLHDRAEKGGANPAPGRVLSDEDILHYRRMVVAITETRRLMREIDIVINDHGGWPDAFVTESR